MLCLQRDREALFVDFEIWCEGLFSLPIALLGSPFARARQARGLLLRHPAELAWLQEELNALPWPPAPGEATSAYDASRAPRLDAVVKAVMRLTPPVGATSAAPWSPLPWRAFWCLPIGWCR